MVLLISQLTLPGDAAGLRVRTGRFGAAMDVELVNRGPITILLESKRTFSAVRRGPSTSRPKFAPMDADDRSEPRAFVLGGNANTLAFVSSFVPETRQITAWLVPLAWTPIGVVLGESWQRVNIAADNIAGWADSTFAPEDERAFVSSIRDLEMLVRIGWHAPTPTELTEEVLVNPDDLPEDLVDAFAHPAETLVQCAICRRTCVRDDFVWNDRRLCAWDYHATVFGKRGPWRSEPYEERHFETLPSCKYVAHPLLDDVGVDAVVAVDGIDDALARRILNEVIAADPARAHLAARTGNGYTLLRERDAGGGES